MTTKEEMFKDESIFQGIKQFNTPCGTIRAENNGATWSIYQEHGNAFIHVGKISKQYKSEVSIYKAAQKAGFFA
jgi:hypothetical protein